MDDSGVPRLVWMFPVRPVPENDVRKPESFVFRNMEDYQQNGKDADARYAAQQAKQKRAALKPGKQGKHGGLIGRSVVHKTNGKGIVKNYDGTVITVKFNSGETKSFNYAVCLEKQLLQIDEVAE